MFSLSPPSPKFLRRPAGLSGKALLNQRVGLFCGLPDVGMFVT
jgi:hypothetical protein